MKNQGSGVYKNSTVFLLPMELGLQSVFFCVKKNYKSNIVVFLKSY